MRCNLNEYRNIQLFIKTSKSLKAHKRCTPNDLCAKVKPLEIYQTVSDMKYLYYHGTISVKHRGINIYIPVRMAPLLPFFLLYSFARLFQTTTKKKTRKQQTKNFPNSIKYLHGWSWVSFFLSVNRIFGVC